MKKIEKVLQTHRRLVQLSPFKKHVEVADSYSKLRDVSSKIMVAIEKGEVGSYADMADIVDRSMSVSSRHYVWVSRLRRNILDEMALQDYSNTMRTEYSRCCYEVHRSLMLAHILKVKGIGTEAVTLWEKTYHKAKKYSLTTEAYTCAHHLCYEYAFRKKYARHYNMMRSSHKLLKDMNAEHEAALLYQRLVLLYKGLWYISPACLPIAKRVSQRISVLTAAHRTHDLYSFHFRAMFYFYYAAHDYRALLKACRKYRAYLENHKHLQQDARWAEIAIHEMNAAVSMGNYPVGILAAEENRKYMRPENPNWFAYLENYFQLLMNAGRYFEAKELYGEVMASSYRKNMTQQQVDVWKVFLAYVQLALHSSGMISRFKPKQHFSILTSCKSDKAGLNFLIEAGLLIYMLIQANRDDIDKHGERFKKYVKRHIDRKLMPRHYLFSKMLLSAVRLRARSSLYIQRSLLKKHELLARTAASRPHDFEANELIRFEKLWSVLIRYLPVEEKKVVS